MLCKLQQKEYNHQKKFMEDPITKDSMGVDVNTRRWEAKDGKTMVQKRMEKQWWSRMVE
jgi:hypothetical protein